MQYLTNRLLVRYLLFLALTFIVCIGFIMSVHTYVRNLDEKNRFQEAQINSYIPIIRTIDGDVYALQSLLYSITAATTNDIEREDIINRTNEHLSSIAKNLSQLGETPCLEAVSSKDNLLSNLPLHLNVIKKDIITLLELANLRDAYMQENNPNLPSIAHQIRATNASVPKVFEKMHLLTNKLIEDTIKRRTQIQNDNAKIQKEHGVFEWIALLGFSGVFIALLVLSFRQLIRLYRQLETQLKIDPLTHLPNRFALIAESRKCSTPLTSILNVNSFRTINELYGVDAGNEVLIRLAQFLEGYSKSHKLELFRISGDEFAFLQCKNGLHVEDFAILMQKLCEKIRAHTFYINSIENQVKISVSCGISEDALNPLGKADMALHRAKQGNECVAIYDKSLDSQELLKSHNYWIEKIQSGIEQDNFMPLYQPIVDAQGVAVHYESLMRLVTISDEGTPTYHPPIHFLSLAHKTKSYPAISKMTLLKAFKFVNTHRIPISVNLCYQDTINQSLKESLYSIISEYQIGPLITFEIVETEDIKNYSAISDFVKEFRTLGVRLALDDFGAGFSNFSYIPNLKPNIIKIDGSLIKELDHSHYAVAMVNSICTLCKELDIDTVAEFVHSEAVFKKALELGVDYFQGYYFSPPILKPKPKEFSFLPTDSNKA